VTAIKVKMWILLTTRYSHILKQN